ncbi:hypothetical protein ABZ547_17625 [Streptomyces sparsogenes]|uniref:hypothetical protein n=1 Tax=Streptomyces sparsogenes TaxID=67365 RepID=UPI0033C59681
MNGPAAAYVSRDVKPEYAPRRCSPEDASHPAPGRLARTRRAGPAAGRRRAAAVVPAAAAVALLTAGCGSDAGSDKAAIGGGGKAGPSANAPAARPAGVEKLARGMGCEAEITTDVDDYRQGVCRTGGANYVFLSFVTARGQRDWLDYAQMYGGSHLVGNRWVVSADSRRSLEAARDKLGGTIEKSAAYAPSSSPSG